MTPTDTPFTRSLVSPPQRQMLLVTFAILALELAMIRWVGTQIRTAAYFSNLVLLAAFLGIGIGAAIGARRPGLFRWALPFVALLSAVLACSVPFGFVRFVFPDPAMHFWGEGAEGWWAFFLACGGVLLCFWAIAAAFALTAIPLGWLFTRMPPLEAYRWDILGSLAGVVAMTFAAWAGSSPPVWLALALVPLVALRPSVMAGAAAAVAIGAAAYSIDGATFSPYNRIDLAPPTIDIGKPALGKPEWKLSVNRDYHQYILDFSRPAPGETETVMRTGTRDAYEIPFAFDFAARRGSAVIVGAGAGNDVAAALRSGFQRVVSVDIDGAIVSMGRKLHPEQPYADARVEVVTNDARAYFEQQRDERFDVVCYGLLDSHAMFSAMSSLRLDNYVYTTEGLRAGWSHVADDGIMSVSFSLAAGPWMEHRIAGLIRDATGIEPIIVGHGYNSAHTFLVGRTLTLERVASRMQAYRLRVIDPAVRIPTDDWPNLYLRPRTLPLAYIVVVALIGLTSFFALRRVFGRQALGRSRFDLHMFLLGAGFMLLQTRMVTELSLLFGSTWVVNACVVGSILAMIALANGWVARHPKPHIGTIYGLLALSLVAIWLFSAGTLNRFDLLERGLLAGLIYGLPVFFAGIVFSTSLRESRDVTASLGANLCGAVFGGLLEYLAMGTGMKALVLVAIALYLASMLARAPQGTGVAGTAMEAD